MQIEHVYNEAGTQHWLRVNDIDGQKAAYRSPAVFPYKDSTLVAVTHFYTGSVEFPNSDTIYQITVFKESVTPAESQE